MEAALVFPIILFIIVSFIYLSFYLHDKYRIEEVLNISILKALEYNQTETNMVTGYIDYEGYIEQGILYRFKSREKKEESVENYLYTYLNDRLIITKVEEITVAITDKELKISAKGYVNIPDFSGLFGDEYNLTFHKDEKNTIHSREFIRLFDVLGGVAEQIPGADHAIELLQNVLKTMK